MPAADALLGFLSRPVSRLPLDEPNCGAGLNVVLSSEGRSSGSGRYFSGVYCSLRPPPPLLVSGIAGGARSGRKFCDDAMPAPL